MKPIFVIANWKSYKNKAEAGLWFETFTKTDLGDSGKEIIVCPQFPLLPVLFDLNTGFAAKGGFRIKLGSQNISPYDEGAYTGEVSGRLLQDYCSYCIIGHSERRDKFAETDSLLQKKTEMANKYLLTPVYCVQDAETIIPAGVSIVAYEPVTAIGTGNPDTPEKADEVAQRIKKNSTIKYVLYGGSVNAENVNKFTQMEHLDGVLVGGASLDPVKFSQLIINA